MYQRQVFLMGKHNWSLFSIWSLLFSKFSIIWRYYFNDQKQEFLLEVFIVSWTFYFLKEKGKLSKVQTCSGPVPVDPGNSKRGRSRSLGKDYLIRNIKRLGKNSVVGKLVEKRGWITWFTWKTNKTSRQEVCTIYVRPLAPTWIVEGALPWAPSRMDLRSQGK